MLPKAYLVTGDVVLILYKSTALTACSLYMCLMSKMMHMSVYKLLRGSAIPNQTTLMCFWSSLSAIAKRFFTVNSLGHGKVCIQAQWPISLVLIFRFYVHFSPLLLFFPLFLLFKPVLCSTQTDSMQFRVSFMYFMGTRNIRFTSIPNKLCSFFVFQNGMIIAVILITWMTSRVWPAALK